MKKLKQIIAIIAISVLFLAFGTTASARAETSEDITQSEQIVEQDKTLFETAKDFIAPIIAGAGISLAGILPIAFLLIRSNMRSKAQNGRSDALRKLNSQLEEKLKTLSGVDYKAEFGTTVNTVLNEFLTQIRERIENIENKFKATENSLAEVLAEQKMDREVSQQIISSMTVAWGSNQDIRGILSQPSTPTALKKEVLKSERLKELVTSIKGDEAEQLILEVENSIEGDV